MESLHGAKAPKKWQSNKLVGVGLTQPNLVLFSISGPYLKTPSTRCSLNQVPGSRVSWGSHKNNLLTSQSGALPVLLGLDTLALSVSGETGTPEDVTQALGRISQSSERHNVSPQVCFPLAGFIFKREGKVSQWSSGWISRPEAFLSRASMPGGLEM